MNIAFDKGFIDTYCSLHVRQRNAMITSISYFSVNPGAHRFRMRPVYCVSSLVQGTYLIDMDYKATHKAVFYLIDNQTALFTHLLVQEIYEQPVVLPQEVQT